MHTPYDLICLSHLRWDFVYQRPQHLLSRCARERRVFFVEEPVRDTCQTAWLEVSQRPEGVWVAVPHLPQGTPESLASQQQMALLDELLNAHAITRYVLWYYTPMARAFTTHLTPIVTVYDCMDELSAFQGAPPPLVAYEKDLMADADLVFTGGVSLYHAKKRHHPRVFALPSSVDAAHFARARAGTGDHPQQEHVGHPRIGFYGVLDERLDRDLVAALAEARPDWSFVLVGPVAKIRRDDLPQRPNLHYMGQQPYSALPDFLAGWDVAMMPFARNEATRYISPTKTLEYLAAGKRVVSTGITDVVHPYRDDALVAIADDPATFVAALHAALVGRDDADWLERVDAFLATHSWDHTWARMARLIDETVERYATLADYTHPTHTSLAAQLLPTPDFASDIAALEE